MNTAESHLCISHSPLRDEQMPPPIPRRRDELQKGVALVQVTRARTSFQTYLTGLELTWLAT